MVFWGPTVVGGGCSWLLASKLPAGVDPGGVDPDLGAGMSGTPPMYTVYICMSVYTYPYVYTCIYIYICVCVSVCLSACTNMYYIYICKHICIYTEIYKLK